MKNYFKPVQSSWAGRASGKGLYLHEKVVLSDLGNPEPDHSGSRIGILGYACDEGVARNQGRPGAASGPEALRNVLGRLPNHLPESTALIDFGNIRCADKELEVAQQDLQDAVALLLKQNVRPLVIGGGHDMAYAHFNGIRTHFGPKVRVGIINFDAHFDLRSNPNGNHSGSPFYQLAEEAQSEGRPFDYLCMGVRKDANDAGLFQRANDLGVHYIEGEDFSIRELTTVQMGLLAFMDQVDQVYVSIDLDGFSSAFAPGVSAPSPMGFSPDIVLEALKTIIDSGKLCSLDLAELNPKYDTDMQTARLAASLLHSAMHRWALL